MAKANKSPAVQATAAALAELSNQAAPALAEHLVMVDASTSVDVDSCFRGDYSPITADRFNSAVDLLAAVVAQWLNSKAEINPDCSEFKLSASDKRAYDTLWKARVGAGLGADSQSKFAARMRAAQSFYAKGCQRKHPLSLGGLVRALGAYTVHTGTKVPSYLETAAKPFQENVAEHGGVFAPAKSEDSDKPAKPKSTPVDLKPSELNLVEAASKELSKALAMANMAEMLELIKGAQAMLNKIVTSKAPL